MHGRATYRAQKSNDGSQTYKLRYTLSKTTVARNSLEIHLTVRYINSSNCFQPIKLSRYVSGEHRKHHRPARNIGDYAAGRRSRHQKWKLLVLRILRRDKQASLEDRGSREASVRRGLRRRQRMRVRSPGRVVDRLDSGQQVHHRLHADDHAAHRRLQSRGTSVPDEGARLHRGPAISEHPARVYGKSWQHPRSDLRHRQSSEN